MISTHPLRVYRETQTPKLSQAGLAKRIGVARLTILRWESGERKIKPEYLPRVTKKTGIPAKKLRPDLVERLAELLEDA